ncbi:hypothetical protein H6758_03035 [Candidatus Nomurabacteria bacterium]|nr:hypothetical protein [Candidatus Nomurabacteria bacterium]
MRANWNSQVAALRAAYKSGEVVTAGDLAKRCPGAFENAYRAGEFLVRARQHGLVVQDGKRVRLVGDDAGSMTQAGDEDIGTITRIGDMDIMVRTFFESRTPATAVQSFDHRSLQKEGGVLGGYTWGALGMLCRVLSDRQLIEHPVVEGFFGRGSRWVLSEAGLTHLREIQPGLLPEPEPEQQEHMASATVELEEVEAAPSVPEPESVAEPEPTVEVDTRPEPLKPRSIDMRRFRHDRIVRERVRQGLQDALDASGGRSWLTLGRAEMLGLGEALAELEFLGWNLVPAGVRSRALGYLAEDGHIVRQRRSGVYVYSLKGYEPTAKVAASAVPDRALEPIKSTAVKSGAVCKPKRTRPAATPAVAQQQATEPDLATILLNLFSLMAEIPDDRLQVHIS